MRIRGRAAAAVTLTLGATGLATGWAAQAPIAVKRDYDGDWWSDIDVDIETTFRMDAPSLGGPAGAAHANPLSSWHDSEVWTTSAVADARQRLAKHRSIGMH